MRRILDQPPGHAERHGQVALRLRCQPPHLLKEKRWPTANTLSLSPSPPLKAPGLYWLLVAGLTICRSGCVVVPFLSLYLVRQQHFSAQDAAQVSAAFGAGWAIGPALAGWLADRIGRRTTLLLTLSGVAAVYLTMPTLDGLTTLTVAAAAVGLLFDAPRPAVLALVADMVPAAARGRAYARLYWASNIGAGVAGGVGALLADAHITTLFYVAATSNTAFAVTVVFCKIGATPAVRPSPGHSTSRRPAVYRDMFRNKPFLALTGLTLLFLCGYQQVLFGLPVAMDRDGLSPSAYGIINLINAVGVVALQPLLQPWTDRRAPSSYALQEPWPSLRAWEATSEPSRASSATASPPSSGPSVRFCTSAA